MKVYNIDYRASEGQPVSIVGVRGYVSEDDASNALLSEGVARLQARGAGDIASLGAPVLEALASFKSPKGQPIAAEPGAVWAAFEPAPKLVTKMPETGHAGSEKNVDSGLQASENDGITSSPAANLASPTEDEQMATQTKKTTKKASKKVAKKAAKKKTAAKKATAPKEPKAPGVPRAGTKKDMLLKLVSRANGATMEEMLKLTNWKACLGTARQVVEATGKKLNIVKDPEGKKVTRWVVA